MFRRVRGVLATDIIDPSIAAPLADLDGAIARLSDHGITQESLTRSLRTQTLTIAERARTIRRDLLRPAALASRTVYPNVGNAAAGLRTAMRMPKRRGDFVALSLTANAAANSIDEHAAAFALSGLPKDFPARLRGAAAELLALIATRSTDEQRRIASTQGVNAETNRGAALVRLLDALVEPALRHDAVRIAEWRKATRIPNLVSSSGKVGPAEVPAGGATPVSSVPAATSTPPASHVNPQQAAA